MPMTPTDKIWMDGELVDWADATVHILTHTMHYGSGVFEGIRAYPTAHGVAVFRLRDHIRRLLVSAKLLLIDVPYREDELVEATREVVRVNKMTDGCYLRPLVYLGYGEMGLNPLPCPVRVAIAAWPWGTYLGDEGVANGVSVKISSWRRHDPNAVPTAAKGTGMYINSSLAKVEALKAGYDEAVLLAPDGQLSECTGENLFVVSGGRRVTPPTSGAGALDGITAQAAEVIAADMGIRCPTSRSSAPICTGGRGVPHRHRRRDRAHPGRRRPDGGGGTAGTDHPGDPADLLRGGAGAARPLQGLAGLCRLTTGRRASTDRTAPGTPILRPRTGTASR